MNFIITIVLVVGAVLFVAFILVLMLALAKASGRKRNNDE